MSLHQPAAARKMRPQLETLEVLAAPGSYLNPLASVFGFGWLLGPLFDQPMTYAADQTASIRPTDTTSTANSTPSGVASAEQPDTESTETPTADASNDTAIITPADEPDLTTSDSATTTTPDTGSMNTDLATSSSGSGGSAAMSTDSASSNTTPPSGDGTSGSVNSYTVGGPTATNTTTQGLPVSAAAPATPSPQTHWLNQLAGGAGFGHLLGGIWGGGQAATPVGLDGTPVTSTSAVAPALVGDSGPANPTTSTADVAVAADAASSDPAADGANESFDPNAPVAPSGGTVSGQVSGSAAFTLTLHGTDVDGEYTLSESGSVPLADSDLSTPESDPATVTLSYQLHRGAGAPTPDDPTNTLTVSNSDGSGDPIGSVLGFDLDGTNATQLSIDLSTVDSYALDISGSDSFSDSTSDDEPVPTADGTALEHLSGTDSGSEQFHLQVTGTGSQRTLTWDDSTSDSYTDDDSETDDATPTDGEANDAASHLTDSGNETIAQHQTLQLGSDGTLTPTSFDYDVSGSETNAETDSDDDALSVPGDEESEHVSESDSGSDQFHLHVSGSDATHWSATLDDDGSDNFALSDDATSTLDVTGDGEQDHETVHETDSTIGTYETHTHLELSAAGAAAVVTAGSLDLSGTATENDQFGEEDGATEGADQADVTESGTLAGSDDFHLHADGGADGWSYSDDESISGDTTDDLDESDTYDDTTPSADGAMNEEDKGDDTESLQQSGHEVLTLHNTGGVDNAGNESQGAATIDLTSTGAVAEQDKSDETDTEGGDTATAQASDNLSGTTSSHQHLEQAADGSWSSSDDEQLAVDASGTVNESDSYDYTTPDADGTDTDEDSGSDSDGESVSSHETISLSRTSGVDAQGNATPTTLTSDVAGNDSYTANDSGSESDSLPSGTTSGSHANRANGSDSYHQHQENGTTTEDDTSSNTTHSESATGGPGGSSSSSNDSSGHASTHIESSVGVDGMPVISAYTAHTDSTGGDASDWSDDESGGHTDDNTTSSTDVTGSGAAYTITSSWSNQSNWSSWGPDGSDGGSSSDSGSQTTTSPDAASTSSPIEYYDPLLPLVLGQPPAPGGFWNSGFGRALAGGLSGAATGGAVGAGVGSIIPGAGTLSGGLLGAGGGFVSGMVSGYFSKNGRDAAINGVIDGAVSGVGGPVVKGAVKGLNEARKATQIARLAAIRAANVKDARRIIESAQKILEANPKHIHADSLQNIIRTQTQRIIENGGIP